jgi:hypothetical protein
VWSVRAIPFQEVDLHMNGDRPRPLKIGGTALPSRASSAFSAHVNSGLRISADPRSRPSLTGAGMFDPHRSLIE